MSKSQFSNNSPGPRPAYQGDPDRVYGMAFAGLEVRFTVAGERLTVLSLDRQNPSS